MDGKIIGADQAKALARLESREVLLSKIAMLVNSPAQQAVNVFAALLRDLGSMLAQVVEQKEREPAAEGGSPTSLGGAVSEEAAAEAEAPVEEAPPAAPEAAEAAQPEATQEDVTEEVTETEEEPAEPAAEAEAEEE
jgi:hypothetical protein